MASTLSLSAAPVREKTIRVADDKAMLRAAAELTRDLLKPRPGIYWADLIASSVVGLFESTIAGFATLAILMPIVSGMGGNAGTQTLAVVVRAIATNQLTDSNTRWMVFRELRIAAANGAALGVLIGIGTFLVFGRTDLALVIAAAMFTNNITAGLGGVLVPVTLDRMNIDPAVSSAVFVTTLTDTMGFFSFLGLATLWGLHA